MVRDSLRPSERYGEVSAPKPVMTKLVRGDTTVEVRGCSKHLVTGTDTSCEACNARLASGQEMCDGIYEARRQVEVNRLNERLCEYAPEILGVLQAVSQSSPTAAHILAEIERT